MGKPKKEKLNSGTNVFKILGLNEKDANKVIDILALNETLDIKVKKLRKLKMKNLEFTLVSLCVLMLYNSIMSKYLDLAFNPRIVENILHSKSIGIGNVVLLLSSVIQHESISLNKYGAFLLILPTLVATRALSIEDIVKVTHGIAKESSMELDDIIRTSTHILTVFSSALSDPLPNVTKH